MKRNLSDNRDFKFPDRVSQQDHIETISVSGRLQNHSSAILQPGFAYAELLAGTTVRLTYKPLRKLSWAPGQYFLINIPDISAFKSHPFSASSTLLDDTSDIHGSAIIFLIRAKDGWTKDLWTHIAQQYTQLHTLYSQMSKHREP